MGTRWSNVQNGRLLFYISQFCIHDVRKFVQIFLDKFQDLGLYRDIGKRFTASEALTVSLLVFPFGFLGATKLNMSLCLLTFNTWAFFSSLISLAKKNCLLNVRGPVFRICIEGIDLTNKLDLVRINHYVDPLCLSIVVAYESSTCPFTKFSKLGHCDLITSQYCHFKYIMKMCNFTPFLSSVHVCVQ